MKPLYFFILILTLSSFAEEQKKQNFTDNKANILEGLTRHSQEIEKAKICITKASETATLKKCTKQLHESVKEIKHAHKMKRKRADKELSIQKIDAKIKKLQQKKAELQK